MILGLMSFLILLVLSALPSMGWCWCCCCWKHREGAISVAPKPITPPRGGLLLWLTLPGGGVFLLWLAALSFYCCGSRPCPASGLFLQALVAHFFVYASFARICSICFSIWRNRLLYNLLYGSSCTLCANFQKRCPSHVLYYCAMVAGKVHLRNGALQLIVMHTMGSIAFPLLILFELAKVFER